MATKASRLCRSHCGKPLAFRSCAQTCCGYAAEEAKPQTRNKPPESQRLSARRTAKPLTSISVSSLLSACPRQAGMLRGVMVFSILITKETRSLRTRRLSNRDIVRNLARRGLKNSGHPSRFLLYILTYARHNFHRRTSGPTQR